MCKKKVEVYVIIIHYNTLFYIIVLYLSDLAVKSCRYNNII